VKFSAITLRHPGMDFAARLRENTYNFSAARGWSIELDGAAVVLTHPDRTAEGLPPTVLPFASVERADLLVQTLAEAKPGAKLKAAK
jgi:hypothetical protein